MAFSKFIRTRATTGEPMISITKFGQLHLNRTCYDSFFKTNKCELVELYFDEEKSLIGIKPVREKSADTYNVRTSRDGKFSTISAIAFLKHYKIAHAETRALQAKWNSKEKLIELDLTQ